MLGGTEPGRALFESAIAQPALDLVELLGKAYIHFEILEGEFGRTRQLYERLLDRTKHVKVWISYAKFEASIGIKDGLGSELQECDEDYTSQICDRAFSYLRTTAPDLKDERAMFLEEGFGSIGDIRMVQEKLPRKVIKRQPISHEDGTRAGYEEYFEHVFPDEVSAALFKILEAAYKCRKQKQDHER